MIAHHLTRGRGRRLLATLAATTAALAAGAPAASAQQTHVDLDAELGELVRMPGGPSGAIIVVQRGDDRQVHTAGVRDAKSEAPVTADDHMRIASTAKAFSAAVALALVEDGKLALD
ncbi:MAG TPA: serine hydrolase domain-containing protein, partial [Capillimicrobium sp.]